jgi:hypothetical protein
MVTASPGVFTARVPYFSPRSFKSQLSFPKHRLEHAQLMLCCSGRELPRKRFNGLLEERFTKVQEKAHKDPHSLSQNEIRLLVNGLPRNYRHKRVPPAFVEHAFDCGALTLFELSRTNTIDLNMAVLAIGKRGDLRKALSLVDYLVRCSKANQHTLAMFFRACGDIRKPQVAVRVWERWNQVRLLCIWATFPLQNALPQVHLLSWMEGMFPLYDFLNALKCSAQGLL